MSHWRTIDNLEIVLILEFSVVFMDEIEIVPMKDKEILDKPFYPWNKIH